MAFANFHHSHWAVHGQCPVILQLRDRFRYRKVFIRPPTTVAMNDKTIQRHPKPFGLPHATLELVGELDAINFLRETATAKLFASHVSSAFITGPPLVFSVASCPA